MARAEALFARINALSGIHIGRFEHGSTIFPLELAADIDCDRFLKTLRDHSISVSPGESDPKCLTLTVNTTILRQETEELLKAFALALK
jgi:hypothetical protein